MTRLICWVIGHRWKTWERLLAGILVVETYTRCDRCLKRADEVTRAQ